MKSFRLDELEAERSARIALQARCEAQQDLLGRRLDDGLSHRIIAGRRLLAGAVLNGRASR